MIRTQRRYRLEISVLGLACQLGVGCSHQQTYQIWPGASYRPIGTSATSRIPPKGVPPSVDDLSISQQHLSKDPEDSTEAEATLTGPQATFGDRFGSPYSANTNWGDGGGSPEHPPPDSARGEPEISANSVAEGYIESIKHQEYTNAPGTTRTIEDDVGEETISGETVYRKNLNPWISPPSTMTSE